MAVNEGGHKKSIPKGLWTKCPKCEQIIYNKELEKNLKICPKCGTSHRMTAEERIALLVDEGSFREFSTHLSSGDPLSFTDTEPYSERLKEARKKTGQKDAVRVGEARIGSHRAALGVMDFGFMGGSMGSVVGEKITILIEHAAAEGLPVVLVAASGGARMQEGILSLFQMAKTSAALAKLAAARQPFLSVLTDPTTGGVTASYAMLGDVIIAEPNALVAFAGPRVIEQTIRQTLPQGFQRSEFLLKHGMVDMVVDRPHLKGALIKLLGHFIGARAALAVK